MLKIGITGGIGSGKSIVSSLFELMGIPVFNSDTQARDLLNTSPDLIGKVVQLFGKQIVDDQGKPDRKKIGSLVFADPGLLEKLNALIHPAVFKAFEIWVAKCDAYLPYVMKEAAIMFESGSDKQNDLNLTVFAPLELRIQRVMNRDGLSRQQVLERIDRQMTEEEKIRRSDYVVYNDEHHSLIEQVTQLDKLFRNRV